VFDLILHAVFNRLVACAKRLAIQKIREKKGKTTFRLMTFQHNLQTHPIISKYYVHISYKHTYIR